MKRFSAQIGKCYSIIFVRIRKMGLFGKNDLEKPFLIR